MRPTIRGKTRPISFHSWPESSENGINVAAEISIGAFFWRQARICKFKSFRNCGCPVFPRRDQMEQNTTHRDGASNDSKSTNLATDLKKPASECRSCLVTLGTRIFNLLLLTMWTHMYQSSIHGATTCPTSPGMICNFHQTFYN